MPATYDLIGDTTLSSGATNITFTSVPSTYTDLRLVITLTGTGDYVINFNGDNGANYANVGFATDGNAGLAVNRTNGNNFYIDNFGGTPTTIPILFTADIASYTSTSSIKSVIMRQRNNQNTGSGSSSYTAQIVGRWNNTAAISTVAVTSTGSNNMGVGSRVSLYGIKAA